jgi:hypothetical protein
MKTPTLCALTVLVYAATLGILGSVLGHRFGFPLDDSWIHQSVARNLAQYGSLGYLPNQRSSGSTSLLWTLLLSQNYTLLPQVSPVLFTLVINSACVFATGVILLLMGLRDGLSPRLALLVSIAPAFDGNYLWLAFIGMEHLLFIALSVASIWFWLAPSRQSNVTSWGPTIAAGTCMGLLCMTRPEGLVLPLFFLAGSLLRTQWRTRSGAQIVAAGCICIVMACIPLTVNLYTSQSLLPVTFKGRRWLLLSDAAGWPAVYLRLAEQWISRPFKVVSSFDGVDMTGLQLTGMCIVLATIVFFIVWGVRALIRERRWLLLSVCAWGALHALLYVFILPTAGHGGRYQPFLLLLLLPLFFLGLSQLFSGSKLGSAAIPAAVLVAVGAVSLSIWNGALASGIDHINNTHGVVAAWLDKNLPGQKVAVFDIGRIGYDRGTRGDPNIIDLGGLTDPAYTQYLYSRQVPRYLALHDIHYLVLPVNPAGHSVIAKSLRLEDDPAVVSRELVRICSAVDDWQLGWSETRNAFQCQEVDRVEFPSESANRPPDVHE